MELFGYVKIFKDELKVKDYYTYRAYYCGLCFELGKRHNQITRLSLSYELTALALLLDSLSDEPAQFCQRGCVKRIGKRKTVCENENLAFAADMNILLAYYKLRDDISDNNSFKARIAQIPFLRRAAKIRKKYPTLCETVKIQLMRLSFLESENCDCIDKAAGEFAKLLESIFAEKEPALAPLGFAMGRLVYMLDAYDDMDKDLKNHSYNPANLQYRYDGCMTDGLLKQLSDSLYYSLADTAEKYSALCVKTNKEILDNIMYLGLRMQADRIINERKNKNEKSV